MAQQSTQQLVQVRKGRITPVVQGDDFIIPETRIEQERTAIRLAHGIRNDKYRLGQIVSRLRQMPETGYLGGKYTNFQQFCRNELHLSTSHVLKLAQVSENFTLQQFQQFGVSTLGVLLHAIKNTNDRRRAMTMLAEGKTLVEIVRIFNPTWVKTAKAWAQGGTSTRSTPASSSARSRLSGRRRSS